MPTQCRTVHEPLQRIDDEAAQWRERLADLEARREQARRQVATMTHERDRQALRAHTGDAQAKKQLAELRKTLFDATQEAEELEIATAKAQETLTALADTRILAVQEAKRQERATLARENRERAEQIDLLLDQVTALAKDWLDTGWKIYGLSSELKEACGRTAPQRLESAIAHHFHGIADLGPIVVHTRLAEQGWNCETTEGHTNG